MSANNIACAYCDANMQLVFGKFTIRPGERAVHIGPPVKCGQCGSRTVIELSTKRAGQGKRYKEVQSKLAAERATLVEASVAAYDAEVARLAAEPGCTCTRGDAGWWSRSDSRDKKSGAMLRNLPEHSPRCPARQP